MSHFSLRASGLLLLGLISFFAHGASAATYWVRPTGTISGCTASASAPATDSGYKATINAGIGCLAAGDTLYIRSGTYDERISGPTIPNGTSDSNRTTIAAYDGPLTVTIFPSAINENSVVGWDPGTPGQYITFDGIVFDATNVVSPNDSNTATGIYLGSSNFLRFQNFELKNTGVAGGSVANPASGFAGGGNGIELLNCNVHDNGKATNAIWTAGAYGWYISGGSDHLIDHCKIHHNGGYGIHIYHGTPNVQRVTIRNSDIYANAQAAVTVGVAGIIVSACNGCRIYNNIIRDHPSPAGGIQVSYGCTNCLIYNNTVYGNARYGISVEGSAIGTVVKNNISYSNDTSSQGWSDIENLGSGSVITNNFCNSAYATSCSVVGNPLFVNVGASDYHIQSTSPAKDAGATLGAPYNVDKDGVVRPVGTAYDIGAYEYGGSVSPPPPPPPCTNLWNSTLAVPASFGASFNWLSTAKEILMNVLCSSGVTLNVGNGTQTEYIYKTGYTWSNNQWTPFNYGGQTMDSTGNWFIGNATANLSVADLTQKQSVLAYICEWTGVWKCGCNDSSCATNYWNLQQFKQ